MGRIGLSFLVTVVLGLALGACGGDANGADPGFAGHWTSSQWGEHYVVVDGSSMMIIYDHDDGRVLGTLDGSTFKGWWTESPSRKPTRDAGEVTFTLTRDGDSRRVDGEWRYGLDGNLRQDWDLTWVDQTIPADILAKFSDAALFSAHP
jgi:hypothetical protein